MNKKILIFLHGTLIMHKSGLGRSREERVQQSINREPSVLDYKNYLPIGRAVEKITGWQEQGNEIIYLNSHEDSADVEKDKRVLDKFGFPKAPILYRQNQESYKDIVEKIKPNVLIEDDCEGIGGEQEMSITNVEPEIKRKIKSIIVKEFKGIDDLPRTI